MHGKPVKCCVLVQSAMQTWHLFEMSVNKLSFMISTKFFYPDVRTN